MSNEDESAEGESLKTKDSQLVQLASIAATYEALSLLPATSRASAMQNLRYEETRERESEMRFQS